MPKVTFLKKKVISDREPVEILQVDCESGRSVLDVALDNGLHIEHACEKSCACTTCHVWIRDGFDSLEDASEDEEDFLDRAWGMSMYSRLSCQVVVGSNDLVVEIPLHTCNQVNEREH